MRIKVIPAVLIAYCICCSSVSYCQDKTGTPLKFSAGFVTGYNRGYGFQGRFAAWNFENDFPIHLRFGLGYSVLNPGNAPDARRIFINNATNGTPEKKGHSIDYRLDFMMPKTVFNVENSYLVFGPRFATYTGDFRYVGGNEDFEVKSHQWGIGAGIENHFRMVKNIEFVVEYGLDFYLPATLTGHDTSYSPDNDNVNAQNDNQNENVPFKYKDADKAINQPKFMPHIMIGLNFLL